MESSKLGLFLPCLNAEKEIGTTLDAVMANPHLAFDEILVVDNGSLDGSIKEVEKRQSLYPNLTLIKNPRNLGYGASHKIAFRHFQKRNFNAVLVIPGDGQGDLESLTTMASLMRNSAPDLCLGSRFMRGGGTYQGYSPVRRLGNLLMHHMQRLCTGAVLTDTGTGQVGYKLAFLATVPFEAFSNEFHFCPELFLWAASHNAKICEVPVRWKTTTKSSVVLTKHVLRMIRMYFYFLLFKEIPSTKFVLANPAANGLETS